MHSFFDVIRTRATDGYVRTILFPETEDERILAAAKTLSDEGAVRPLLVCSKESVGTVKERGLEPVPIETETVHELERFLIALRASKVGTKDEMTSEEARALALDPLMYAAYLLRTGNADGMVAGAVRTTAEVMRAGLWVVGKADGTNTVSSSFYMAVPPFRGGNVEEVLTFTDCAVVPEPTPDQLADIAIAASDARRRVVGDEPRVAFLSYSTKGSGNGPSVDAVREATEAMKKRRPDIVVDGEFQADAALIASVAKRKAPESPVGGTANVLVFPSLDAGNIAYKLVERLTPGAKAVGPILQGIGKPMSDLSRGAASDDIIRTTLVVASQAERRA